MGRGRPRDGGPARFRATAPMGRLASATPVWARFRPDRAGGSQALTRCYTQPVLERPRVRCNRRSAVARGRRVVRPV